MALVHFHFLFAVEIVDAHPRVACAAGDELTLLGMQRHARNFGVEFDGLEKLAWGGAGEEIGVFARGDGERGRAAEGVELTAADGGGEGVSLGRGTGAEVPPADSAVVGGGDQDVEVRAPDDGFDRALVDAWADFVGWGWWRRGCGGAVLLDGGGGRG